MTGGPPSRRVDAVVLAALAVWAADARVLAYIDPGSGALIWQAVVAAFVGAGVLLPPVLRPLLRAG